MYGSTERSVQLTAHQEKKCSNDGKQSNFISINIKQTRTITK